MLVVYVLNDEIYNKYNIIFDEFSVKNMKQKTDCYFNHNIEYIIHNSQE